MNNNQNLIMMGVTLAVAIGIIIGLYALTPNFPNKKNNGFTRSHLYNSISLVGQKRINLPIEGIRGSTDEHIFVNIPNPQWLIMVDHALKEQDTIGFPVNLNEKILSGNSFVVDSPLVYLFVNNLPGFIFGRIEGKHAIYPVTTITKSLFTKSAYVSPSSVILRSFDETQRNQVFQKVNSHTGKVVSEAQVTNKTEDGGFSTDGFLQYDKTTSQIIYVQLYSNQFYSLDTNLIVRYIGKTIDTLSNNQIEIKKAFIKGSNRIVPGRARVTINKYIYLDSGLLFVLSGLRADNETPDQFKQNTIIDIYEITKGNYMGSLVIPSNGKIVKSILIKNKFLFVLYDQIIECYSIKLHV